MQLFVCNIQFQSFLVQKFGLNLLKIRIREWCRGNFKFIIYVFEVSRHKPWFCNHFGTEYKLFMLRSLGIRRSIQNYKSVPRASFAFSPSKTPRPQRFPRFFSIMSQINSQEPPTKIAKIASKPIDKSNPDYKPIVWIDCEVSRADCFCVSTHYRI